MTKVASEERPPLTLKQFSHLTQSMAVSSYSLRYCQNEAEKQFWLSEFNEAYNPHKLAELLHTLSQRLGTEILNLSHQAYEPVGASATVMVAEGNTKTNTPSARQRAVAHLDKSHLAAHTYLDAPASKPLVCFRLDIDISSCGLTSPMIVLDELIKELSPDVCTIDFLVRGFNFDEQDNKQFIPSVGKSSIDSMISPMVKNAYKIFIDELPAARFSHVRLRRNINLEFQELSAQQKGVINSEAEDIFTFSSSL